MIDYMVNYFVSFVHTEIYIAVLAVLVTAWALWLRWRKGTATIEPETLSQ